MSDMEESYNRFQQADPDMEASFNKFQGQSIGNIPEGQSQLPPPQNENMDGATGWEMDKGQWKKIPSFVTKLKAIGSAAAESTLDFSAALLNQPVAMMRNATKGTSLEKYDTKGPTLADTAHEYWSGINEQNAKEYSGIGKYQAAGALIPELAAFAVVDKGRSLLSKPIEALGTALKGAKIPGTDLGVAGVNATGKLLEKIGQGPEVIGKAAPHFTKTALEYGAAAGRDLTTFSAVEGLRYNPENPEQGFNSDKALEMLENPSLAAAASAVGHKFGKYMANSRALGKAKDTYSPYATAYQLKEQGPSRTFMSKALGVLPNLFGWGKLIDQLESTSADTRDFIGKILGTPEISRSVDAGEKAGRYVQAALKRTKLAEDHAWNAVPQNVTVAETDHVKKITSNILQDLKNNSPIDSRLLGSLETFISKPSFTSGDVKKIHTKIGNVLSRLYSHDDVALMAGEGNIINRIKEGKDGLLNILQGNLDDAGNRALDKARNISTKNFELMGISPMVPKAVENGVEAQKIADKLISETTGSKVMDPVLGKMSGEGKNAVAKYKLLKSLDKYTNPDGSVNLGGFIKDTGPLSQQSKLMGKGTLAAYEGFLKYLQGVDEAAKTGWWTQSVVAGTVGTAAATKGGVSKTLGMVVAASYPVLGFIANHAPIKSLLHAATRKLPDDTYNAVMKNIEKHLTRAGFYISDGVINKKENK